MDVLLFLFTKLFLTMPIEDALTIHTFKALILQNIFI